MNLSMGPQLAIVKRSNGVPQSLLRSIVKSQNLLRQLKKIDQANRRELRALVLAGASVEPGEHYVEIHRTASGHRLVVR